MRIEVSMSGQRHRLSFFRNGEGGELFHADTINVFDDRQRQRLTTVLVDQFGIDRAIASEKLIEVVRELRACEDRTADESSAPANHQSAYQIHNGRFIQVETQTELSNFTSEIVEELICDDGVEQRRFFRIRGEHFDGAAFPEVRIPAADFEKMDWVTSAWGARAIIGAGRSVRDHLRAAIQEFSHDVQQRHLFGHTGWRQIGDEYLYLHAGGAIGADGVVSDIEVDLPPALENYELPAPPTGDRLCEAIRTNLELLDIGPDKITVPLVAAPYRAVLGDSDFALHFVGPSGSFKSTVTALSQQHFGPRMDATHLPGNWSSSANSLEGIAFLAKDATFTIDDFTTSGNNNQIQAAHRDADRLIRAQGNRSGRQRMRADGTIRPMKPPRGIIVSTGEDIPRGHSVGARMLVTEVSPGDIRLDRLTEMQQDANAGRCAESMAAFIQWVAPRFAEIQTQIREALPELRESLLVSGVHARTPGIAAQLLIGVQYFLTFAVEARCLTGPEANAIESRCMNALRAAISTQREAQAITAPEQQFITLVASALATGRAHLEPVEDRRPDYLRHFGWHPSSSAHFALVPRGEMIGYVQNDDVYLNPEVAFAAAQQLARDGSDMIPIGVKTLVKRLHEAEMLIVEQSQNTHLHRITVGGRRMRAIRLRPGVLAPHQEPIDPETADDGISDGRRPTNLGRRDPRFPNRSNNAV